MTALLGLFRVGDYSCESPAYPGDWVLTIAGLLVIIIIN
jgi:hypothetical protein